MATFSFKEAQGPMRDEPPEAKISRREADMRQLQEELKRNQAPEAQRVLKEELAREQRRLTEQRQGQIAPATPGASLPPRTFSFEEAQGLPPPKTKLAAAPGGVPEPSFREDFEAHARKKLLPAVSGIATLGDMALGLPHGVMSVLAELNAQWGAFTQGKSRKEGAAAGAAARKAVNEAAPQIFTGLVNKLKNDADLERKDPVEATMGYLDELIKKSAVDYAWQSRKGKFSGVLPDLYEDEYEGLFNEAFNVLGARGAVVPAQRYIKRMEAKHAAAVNRPRDVVPDDAIAPDEPLRVDPAAKRAEAAAAGQPGPYRPIRPDEFPQEPRPAATPSVAKWQKRTDAAKKPGEIDALRNAELQASGLMARGASKAQVEAVLKKNPLVGEAMDAILERRRAVVDSRLGEVQQFGPNDIYGPGESAYPPARGTSAKAGPEGQLSSSPAGAKLRLGYTPAAAAAALAIGAYAATAEDHDALALAAAAPLAIMPRQRRGGVPMTMETLRAQPADASLAALLAQQPYTLKTLERLPDGRTEFPAQMVREQLKRQDVTGAERAVLEKVLEGKDKISARDLVLGAREGTANWELRRKETDSFASYGLEGIDRRLVSEFEVSQEDIAEATVQRSYGRADSFDVLTPDGTLLGAVVLREYQTLEAALAEWKERKLAGGVEASTNLYRLPDNMQLSDNNHFSDPQLFGWTRSFTEDGVRHVVEVQSDLAQRVGKVLGEEERGQLTKSLTNVKEQQRLLAPFPSQYFDYRTDPHLLLKELLPALAAVEKLNPDVYLKLGRSIQNGGWFESAGKPRGDSGPLSYVRQFPVQDPEVAFKEFVAYLGRPEENANPARAWRDLRDAVLVYRDRLFTLAAEHSSKLRESTSTAAVNPILKNWPKRLIREELANAAAARAELEAGQQRVQQHAAQYKEELSQGWLTPEEEGAVQDLLSEHQRLLKSIEKELAGAEVVRFATADTVAKVEGWPKERVFESSAEGMSKVLKGHQLVGNVQELGGSSRYGQFGFTGRVRASADGDAVMMEIYPLGEPSNTFWTSRAADSGSAREAAAVLPSRVGFRPEHQGIYDRYKTEIEKFLAQQGGTPHTDSAGHTWIEVPTARYRYVPEMFAAAGLGTAAALAYAMSEGGGDEAATMAAFFAIPRGVRRGAKSAVGLADEFAGAMSTRIKNISEPIHSRAMAYELGVRKTAHDYFVRTDEFVKQLGKVRGEDRKMLDRAILTNDPEMIRRAFQIVGNGRLSQEWGRVRAVLDEVGGKLKESGRLEVLRDDYFPRIVKDYEGLAEELGVEVRGRLTELLRAAEKRSIDEGRGPLTEVERSLIINKNLRTLGLGDGKPGFSKKRQIDEVTGRLQKYYASPEESLHSYIAYAVKDLERARFFGRDLVEQMRDGRRTVDVDASIGALVERELRERRITDEQAQELGRILEARFHGGEKAGHAAFQDLRNIGYLGAMADPASAVIQPTDVLVTTAVQGLRPTLRAVAETLTGHNRYGRADFGLVDHISEEFVSKRATAKAVNGAFRAVGLNLLDGFGKNVTINAAYHRGRELVRTQQGTDKLAAEYAEALGTDFPALAEELRAGRGGPQTELFLWSELSRTQPVSMLEMPEAYARNPNGRLLYSLKSWMLKQGDVARREAYNEIRTGEARKVQRGLYKLGKLATAFGVAGLSADWARDFLLGREVDFENPDVVYSVLKTFGWSEYVADKVDEARKKKQSTLQAAAVAYATPPALPVLDDIFFGTIDGDWARVRKRLPFGRTVDSHLYGGAERTNAQRQARRDRKADEVLRGSAELQELEKKLRGTGQ